jgi:hypothetical protein
MSWLHVLIAIVILTIAFPKLTLLIIGGLWLL